MTKPFHTSSRSHSFIIRHFRRHRRRVIPAATYDTLSRPGQADWRRIFAIGSVTSVAVCAIRATLAFQANATLKRSRFLARISPEANFIFLASEVIIRTHFSREFVKIILVFLVISRSLAFRAAFAWHGRPMAIMQMRYAHQ